MLPYNGGVTAAFANGPVYFSPNGRDVGGGGNTRQVYSGTQTAVGMLEYNGGIFTAFSGRSIYFSPTGQNLGGGGNTMRVYPVGQQVARALTGMVRYNGGVITALYNQFSVTLEPSTAFFSPDGRNLGGDGSTSQIYP